MAGNKPTVAFALSLVAGLLILIGAIWIGFIESAVAGMVSIVPGAGAILMIFAIIGIIFALLVLLGAVMMWVKPQSHVAWGVIVLLFSLFSIISGGGFILGLILGLVGGILAIVWKPEPAMPTMMPPVMQPPMAPPPQ